MARVRIIDVARAAGVSLGTVSNALNHPSKVRPETRRLIEDAIRELGYVPNQSARLLAGGQNATIGLVLPRLNHGASLLIANGAEREARKLGFDLLIANADTDPELERHYMGYFMGIQVAGMLVQPADAEAWIPPAAASMPVVCLNARHDAPGCSVAAEHRAQGRLVTAHLIRQGATRIAVIGRAARQPMRLRLKGIRDALSERPDVTCEVLDAGEWNVSGDGYTLGEQLARRAPDQRPNAIIGLTDVLAAGALAGAAASGIAVPDELLVAGCDGNPLAWGGAVPLTTCAPVGYEIGRKGVQLLAEELERAQGAGRTDHGAPRHAGEPQPRQEIVRPFLLARASTGCPAATNAPGDLTSRVALIPELNLGAYL